MPTFFIKRLRPQSNQSINAFEYASERAFIKCEVPTSDASDVIADVFLESVCIGLLEVEILEMLFEDLIGRLVGFAQIL